MSEEKTKADEPEAKPKQVELPNLLKDVVIPNLKTISDTVKDTLDSNSEREFRAFRYIYWLLIGASIVIVSVSLLFIYTGLRDEGLTVLHTAATYIAGFLSGMGLIRSR